MTGDERTQGAPPSYAKYLGDGVYGWLEPGAYLTLVTSLREVASLRRTVEMLTLRLEVLEERVAVAEHSRTDAVLRDLQAARDRLRRAR